MSFGVTCAQRKHLDLEGLGAEWVRKVAESWCGRSLRDLHGRRCFTFRNRSGPGRLSTVAAQPTRSGRRPNNANTRPLRSGPGWTPPSTRHPRAAPGSSVAEGAAMPLGVFAIPLCNLLACRPGVWLSYQCFSREVRPMRREFADVDGPERTADGREILRVADFLVAKELSPGAVRRVAEIVGQFALRVPPAGGLR